MNNVQYRCSKCKKIMASRTSRCNCLNNKQRVVEDDNGFSAGVFDTSDSSDSGDCSGD